MAPWREVDSVVSLDGTRLHVVEAGDPDSSRALLMIHGFSQRHCTWSGVLGGGLLPGWRRVALDLRGHGRSGKPQVGYDESALWAADLRAVIDQRGLDEVVPLAWSYGGLVIGDYLACTPAAPVSGLVLVAAATAMRPSPAADGFFATARRMSSPDDRVRKAGITEFVASLTHGEAPAPWRREFTHAATLVPPHVLDALLDRTVDVLATIASYDAPKLIIHGADDRLLPSTASEVIADASGTRVQLIPGVGHTPFVEAPESFEAKVVQFVDSIT
jgi:non-heme chloroperoxidase